MKAIEKPRCPKCGRLQAISVVEGHFRCPKCGTEFKIGDGYVTILTNVPNSVMVKIK